MEREEFQQLLRGVCQISNGYWCKPCDKSCHFYPAMIPVLAEFDRLNGVIESEQEAYHSLHEHTRQVIKERDTYFNANKRLIQERDEAKVGEQRLQLKLDEWKHQSQLWEKDYCEAKRWLDRISEPVKLMRDIDNNYIKGRAPFSIGIEQVVRNVYIKVCDYLDSQQEKPKQVPWVKVDGSLCDCPTCNPKPKCEHKNRIMCSTNEDNRPWCTDCHTWIESQPLSLCPECIWGQVKISHMVTDGKGNILRTHHSYERCPRCHGERVIPKEGKEEAK